FSPGDIDAERHPRIAGASRQPQPLSRRLAAGGRASAGASVDPRWRGARRQLLPAHQTSPQAPAAALAPLRAPARCPPPALALFPAWRRDRHHRLDHVAVVRYATQPLLTFEAAEGCNCDLSAAAMRSAPAAGRTPASMSRAMPSIF